MTMRFIAKFYPNTEKEVEEAQRALEEVKSVLGNKTAYSVDYAQVVKTKETSFYADGAAGFFTDEKAVVKLDFGVHFRDDAFPRAGGEGHDEEESADGLLKGGA